MLVRRIEPEEWEQLRAIRLNALADAPEAFGSTLEREREYADDVWREWARDGADGATELCLVASEGDALVGMAVGFVEEGRDHAHLVAMWVAPDVRRRGIGRRLVSEVVAWARARGLAAVKLDVTVDNDAARRLYEACGFRLTGKTGPFGPRPELVVSELRLDLDQ
jgi:ribosomal protein S18 acetylase RimI-like enzyme